MSVPLAGILAIAGTALAAPAAANSQGVSFNCDSDSGSVATMDQQALRGATAISGTVRPLQIKYDRLLRPAATIKLATRRNFVALQLTPDPESRGLFDVFVRNGSAQEEERTPMLKAKLDDTVPFKIELAGKEVHVTAGDQRISVTQDFSGRPNVGVSCSTGRFQFDNVQVR
jgi:hypothetical protein